MHYGELEQFLWEQFWLDSNIAHMVLESLILTTKKSEYMDYSRAGPFIIVMISEFIFLCDSFSSVKLLNISSLVGASMNNSAIVKK